MTAQIAESLHYEGRSMAMCSNPLGDYFALADIHPGFAMNCTALWRGYVGTWEILDGRLYLIGLKGELEDGTRINLASIFPDYPERVFAHWYSGKLRIPQGKLLQYVHMGYGSIYEDDLFIDIRKGVVINTEVLHNGTSENPHAKEGYGIGGMTIFPPDNHGGEEKK